MHGDVGHMNAQHLPSSVSLTVYAIPMHALEIESPCISKPKFHIFTIIVHSVYENLN